METIEREPCHHCGEPTALAARVCPHCKSGVPSLEQADSKADRVTLGPSTGTAEAQW